MKKALITGISGFAGSFLTEHLLEKKIRVSGIYVDEKSLVNLDKIKNDIQLFRLDLLKGKKVLDLVSQIKPDYVFHLAALTAPKNSFDSPFETIENNVKAQLNILESVRKLNLLKTRILVISSGEVYGIVKREDLPIDESTPLMPLNPYAVSKITQDFLGLQYHLSYKLRIVRVRPFNHIGPRQSEHFAVGAFAKKIAEVEKGIKEPVLPVGNLSSRRDFTDVRDMVRAYLLALEKGKEGEVYNIGSGVSYAISEILDRLLTLSRVEIKIRKDESLMRPVDNPELVCDRTKFSNLTGFRPTIPIEKTLEDTLDYWRNII
ncbi:MAG: hypothetical protein A2629_01785 [Candidatus Levybacteria bacterium RIFCSPHIGHO2_01_FULL_41_15]|nr:MAG: hypothetical protein A2629_01785 [Candidatus Levybacteria bacterium RIFCSPHIGHO2_01_FULL_41_15]